MEFFWTAEGKVVPLLPVWHNSTTGSWSYLEPFCAKWGKTKTH